MSALIPVLEVGGTHVSAALVDPDGWAIRDANRYALDADASAADLIARFVHAGRSLAAGRGRTWGVAMPDPFDYERGIAQFEGVGKFGALRGVDLGAALRAGLRGAVTFVNDADAFTLGEWAAGSARGAAPRRRAHARHRGRLGVGRGRRGLRAGAPPGRADAPHGRRRAPARGRVLAARPAPGLRRGGWGCRRRRARDRRTGPRRVAAGAPGAGRGDPRAGPGRRALPAGFRADVLVVGGSMAASWDLFAPAFRAGALGVALPPIKLAADSAAAPLVGAALHAQRVAAR